MACSRWFRHIPVNPGGASNSSELPVTLLYENIQKESSIFFVVVYTNMGNFKISHQKHIIMRNTTRCLENTTNRSELNGYLLK